MKRIAKFWWGCWKASIKTKVGESPHWIQYYNVWTNGLTTKRKSDENRD